MTTSKQTDLLREIVKADPEFHEDKRKVVEYKFGNGKQFTGNPATRGAYADD